MCDEIDSKGSGVHDKAWRVLVKKGKYGLGTNGWGENGASLGEYARYRNGTGANEEKYGRFFVKGTVPV